MIVGARPARVAVNYHSAGVHGRHRRVPMYLFGGRELMRAVNEAEAPGSSDGSGYGTYIFERICICIAWERHAMQVSWSSVSCELHELSRRTREATRAAFRSTCLRPCQLVTSLTRPGCCRRRPQDYASAAQQHPVGRAGASAGERAGEQEQQTRVYYLLAGWHPLLWAFRGQAFGARRVGPAGGRAHSATTRSLMHSLKHKQSC